MREKIISIRRRGPQQYTSSMAVSVLMVLAIAAATQASQPQTPDDGARCSSAADCNLNGDCVAARCRCDAGWRGSPACGVLALSPVDKENRPGVHNASAVPCGASPIQGPDGRWHVFHAQISRNCSVMNGWIRNSFIARSVSATVGAF